MLLTVTGLIVFIALHSLRGHMASFRDRLIAKLGLFGFRILFSMLTIASLLAIGLGLSGARQNPVVIWQPDPLWRPAMSYAMYFVALGFAARWVPATYLRYWLKQPVLLAIVLWSLLHFDVGGLLHQMIVYFIILLWSVFALWRDRHEVVDTPVSFYRDLIAIVLAGVLWYGFAVYLHAAIIGVSVIIF